MAGVEGLKAGTRRRWDVALSFAGAQRNYVEQVAVTLKARGVRCFYDADEQVRLWGTNLAEELPQIYAHDSTAVVVFVSAEYAGSEWTRLERRAAFSQAVAAAGVYVLPARFDDSVLPGLLPDVVSVDLRRYTPEQFADLVVAKLVGLTDGMPGGQQAQVGPVGGRPPAGVSTDREAHSAKYTGTDRYEMRSDFKLVVPRQLPPANQYFAGRAAELQALTRLIDQGMLAGGPVVISAINGTAGIGKTALAVNWAHQMASRFTDGQLYVNLRGFDQSGKRVAAGEAVRGFLDAFAIPAHQIPRSLEAQLALYRSLLAPRRILVILDNARDVGQVRPLLPGGPNATVVVTSRNRLTSLAVTEGAHLVTLDHMEAEEARELLARRLGEERLAGEPAAVAEIIDLCAGLPLALAIVGARAAAQPDFPLETFSAELHDERNRLSAFDAGDPASNVRAVFSWSYHVMSRPAAKLFRLLSLHPGPDMAASAVNALFGKPSSEARRELTDAHLIQERVPGRYTFHDLLRGYAKELTLVEDTEKARRIAMSRLFDHYLRTAYRTAMLLLSSRESLVLSPVQPGSVPEDINDPERALAWFATERAVLLASVRDAAEMGFDIYAWQIAWALSNFLDRQGHWNDWRDVHTIALEAAIRSNDLRGQAYANRGLCQAYGRLRRYSDANSHAREAIKLFNQIGDNTGLAYAERSLGWILERQGHINEALDHAKESLRLFQNAGNSHGRAIMLNAVGWYYALAGEYGLTLTFCEEALPLLRELGDRNVEAGTLDSIGYAYHQLGQPEHAIGYYDDSINLFIETGDRYWEAFVRDHQGNAYLALGATDAARSTWHQALAIFDELGHTDADKVRTKLRELNTVD